MLMDSFTLLMASMACPSEALGARLNERVTTGNCPWWFTVMGALISSKCVKAASGTWPPLGNFDEEAIGPLPTGLPVAAADELPEDEVEARLELAAESELEGPNNCAPPLPPATRPAELLELAAPVRIYKLRRSKGLL